MIVENKPHIATQDPEQNNGTSVNRVKTMDSQEQQDPDKSNGATSVNTDNRRNMQEQESSNIRKTLPLYKDQSNGVNLVDSKSTNDNPTDPSQWTNLRQVFPEKEVSDIVFEREGTRTIGCQLPNEYLLETVALTVRDVISNLMQAYDDDCPLLIELIPHGINLSMIRKVVHQRMMKENKRRKTKESNK